LGVGGRLRGGRLEEEDGRTKYEDSYTTGNGLVLLRYVIFNCNWV
jgi:hypothetical protein